MVENVETPRRTPGGAREVPCMDECRQALWAALILNAVYLAPMFAPGIGNLGLFDSDQHFYFVEAVRKTLLEYGQFPAWDPWHAGGMPLIGNPQSPISPFYLPVLFFGTVAGLKVSLFILQIAGFIGTYFLARHLSLNHAGGLVAALIWSFSGMHAVQAQAGWFLFLHLHLLPWAFLFFFRGMDDFRFAVPLGFIFALFFMGGVPYPLPITIFAMAVIALVLSIERRSPRPLILLGLSVAVTLPLIAVKLIPALEWISGHPRDTMSVIDGYSVTALSRSLMEPGIDINYQTPLLYGKGAIPGSSFYVASEYGIYVGPVVLILAVIGLFVKFPHKKAIISALVALILVAMGDYSPIPLWSLLKKLPVYDSMRVVERFRWAILLIISLLAAFGMVKLSAFFKNPRLFAYAILSAIFLNLLFVSAPILYRSFPVKPEKVLMKFNDTGNFFQINQSKWYNSDGWQQTPNRFLITALYPFVIDNVGVTRGYEPHDIEIFARGSGSPEYKGEAFISTQERFMEARITDWSPNRVTVEWERGTKGDLYLNQNFYEGWKVCGSSGLSVAESGLLRVPVSEKDSKVTLCFAPLKVYIGAVISFLSAIGFIIYTATVFRITGVRS